MNIKELKELIDIFENANITELDLEREGVRIRLKKGEVPKPPAIQVETKREVPEEVKGVREILSPMVGTFYRSPSPESRPFVEIGDEVEEDQVICIIEAMKLMNEIKAEIKGKIIKVLVESGQPVEFGQPLFVVEPL